MRPLVIKEKKAISQNGQSQAPAKLDEISLWVSVIREPTLPRVLIVLGLFLLALTTGEILSEWPLSAVDVIAAQLLCYP